MATNRPCSELFALASPPPTRIAIAGADYRLVRVFKHDFFAATTLYESAAPAAIPRIVVKFYRTRPFCGVPMDWLGRLSREHERAIYAALAGVGGVPRWVGGVGQAACAVEYVDALPLDQRDAVPCGYFDRLRRVFDAVHARGVAYVDGNKRSNLLVAGDGRPFVVDFQIALRRREDWPWPARALVARIVRYLQDRDLYHLYTHKRRLAPGELSEGERTLSRQVGLWHRLHRRLTKPYRAIRRRFLRRQYRAGRLVSPTENLEDRALPEQRTWKKR